MRPKDWQKTFEVGDITSRLASWVRLTSPVFSPKMVYLDVAYELLLKETYPSWLYPVKMGATTIWERWDGIKT